ncbi:MAG TPA: ferric reductase-like transmembrane domain-containing protein [Streptosporangiaceae bacterium]
MTAITQSTALWYASRATGVVSLLMLSLVVILGIAVNRQGRLPGLPAFAVTGLHRSLALLSVLFLAAHVATAVIDPYVSIRAAAVVIPFVSAYEPFWLGLGAVALDLMAALIITSLARARMPRRAWRGIHWLAYAAWPVALIHSVGASTDLRTGWLGLMAAGCAIAVGAAGLWRLTQRARQMPRAGRAAAVLAGAQPPSGPARRSHVPDREAR